MRTPIVCLLVLSTGAAGLAAAAESTSQQTVATEPRGVVEISNTSGSTEVTGWDKSEVEVRADVDSNRIRVESGHGRVSISVTGPGPIQTTSARLQIRVPRDSELDISGVSADVATTDVAGVLQLKTVSGRVKADVFQKVVEVKTISGDVVLRGRGTAAGADGIHVSSVSGTIRIDRAGGDLEVTNISGDMVLRLDHAAHEVRVRSTSGDVSFEGKLGKGGSLEAQTVSGDLLIRAEPEGSLDYEVNTFSGDIRNCMGQEAQRTSQYAPGKRLNGTRGAPGAGEARVRLKSMSGDVELCDKT
jgi:DUF4097 and DUF4098 domain-containing protein YvlB